LWPREEIGERPHRRSAQKELDLALVVLVPESPDLVSLARVMTMRELKTT
jgi:hypothetical protein